MEVPAVCRAVVCTKRGPDFVVEARYDYPVPEPKDDEILIKINCTGLCQSDIHHLVGDLGLGATADCPGHEGAGVVAKLGSRVTKWKVGDRVGVKPAMYACGRCEFCTQGLEMNCPEKIGTAWFRNGSYCQYMTHTADYATRLPDGIPDHIAAPILCAGATVFRAVRISNCKLGEWMVIPGAGGGVGALACQYAAAQGIRVIAVDTGAEKKSMCLQQLGCEEFIDFKEISDIPAEVKRITGLGAHALIVTGGTKAAYARWTDILRAGGTLIVVGLPAKGTVEVGADPILYVTKSLTVKGSMVASLRETDEAIAAVASGKVKPVVQVYPFDQFVEQVGKLYKGQLVGRVVIKFDD